jgi:transcriptional regulator with GAF, ATPase, and Fis domain
VQVKLLRPLEAREYVPLGETRPRKIVCRIVCATHRDLPAMCREGTFRPDLHERLNGMRAHLPPVRQIDAESKGALAGYVRGMVAATVADPADVDEWTARVLRSIEEHAPHYLWPRNFRELKNYVERFVMTGGNTPPPGAPEHASAASVVAAPAAFEAESSGPPSSGILGSAAKAGRLTLDEVQRAYVTQVYALTGENKAETGRRTGLDWRKVERFVDRARLARLRPRRG